MSKQKFVGSWKLLSLKLVGEDKSEFYPYGENAKGRIMYSDSGYMSVVLMPADRVHFLSEDILKGTDEEKTAAADSYLSYTGKYSIANGKVIHEIDASFFPNWTGVEQARFYEFAGNTLTLMTPAFQVAGVECIGYLIWEKE
jgi:hypothetical protein